MSQLHMVQGSPAPTEKVAYGDESGESGSGRACVNRRAVNKQRSSAFVAGFEQICIEGYAISGQHVTRVNKVEYNFAWSYKPASDLTISRLLFTAEIL